MFGLVSLLFWVLSPAKADYLFILALGMVGILGSIAGLYAVTRWKHLAVRIIIFDQIIIKERLFEQGAHTAHFSCANHPGTALFIIGKEKFVSAKTALAFFHVSANKALTYVVGVEIDDGKNKVCIEQLSFGPLANRKILELFASIGL